MSAPLFIPVTPAAMLTAVACVIAGGPWFADGLRALRQRRMLAMLATGTDAPLAEGPVAARGHVVLASPLFAPLTGRACAGFVLEVSAPGTTMLARIADTRAFRLATRDGLAEIEAAAARWDLAIGSERTVASPAELSANVQALLGSTPELRWLASRGSALVLRERALLAGADAVVFGVATRLAEDAVAERVELARTGTDDASWSVSESQASSAPGWRVEAGESFERCVVCDREPVAASLAPPAWRLVGAVLGPALSLAGLIVLAEAAGHVMDGGR